MSQNFATCLSARVLQNWIDMVCDLGHKPHLIINRNVTITRQNWDKEVQLDSKSTFDVPFHVEKDGVSVWNVSPSAIPKYFMDMTKGILYFTVSLKGRLVNLVVPVEHITNIYVPNHNLNIVSDSLTFVTVEDKVFKISKQTSASTVADMMNQVPGTTNPDTDPTPPVPPKPRPTLRVVK
jgi:stringent starvation protein B